MLGQEPVVLTLDVQASDPSASEDRAEVFSLLYVLADPLDKAAWPDGEGAFERERRILSAERLGRDAEKFLAQWRFEPERATGRKMGEGRWFELTPMGHCEAAVEETFGVRCLHMGGQVLYKPVSHGPRCEPQAGNLPQLALQALGGWVSERFGVCFGQVCRAGRWIDLVEADAPDDAVETEEGKRLFEEAVLHLASGDPGPGVKKPSL